MRRVHMRIFSCIITHYKQYCISETSLASDTKGRHYREHILCSCGACFLYSCQPSWYNIYLGKDKNTGRLVVRPRQIAVSNPPPWSSVLCGIFLSGGLFMNEQRSMLQVYFEDPFWVGLFQRWESGKLRVCKVTFGAKPKEQELYCFLQTRYAALAFGPAVPDSEKPLHKNPKRRLSTAHVPYQCLCQRPSLRWPHISFCSSTTVSTCESLSKLRLMFSSIMGSLNLMDFSHCPLG